MTGEVAVETGQAGTGTPRAETEGGKVVCGKKKASKREKKEFAKGQDAGSGKGVKRSSGKEAHHLMGCLSGAIVGQLAMRSKQGDPTCAKALVGMADKEALARKASDHGPLRSQALAWAAEPPWQEEIDQQAAETVNGSREAD